MSELESGNNIPEFMIEAVSNLISQYITELNLDKNKNVMIKFSAFCEHIIHEIKDGKEQADEISKCADINELYSIAEKRKALIKDNFDVYNELKHLLDMNIPEYVLISIITSLNFIETNMPFELDFETRSFYSNFGEQLVLDLRNTKHLDNLNKI